MIDNVIPKDKWEFDQNVTDCFDDMLKRSIPNYEIMRSLIEMIIKYHNPKKSDVLVDLGCSNGINIEPFIDDMNCIGVDISEPMLESARLKFKDKVKILYHDITDNLDFFDKAKFITSILTLQFTPMEYRQEIFSNIYNKLENDGIFIIVEKELGFNSVINKMFVNLYYNIKAKNGYSYDQINRKKKSLEGVLVPVTSEWNKELLRQAGFKKFDTFWRCLNFEGIVAFK